MPSGVDASCGFAEGVASRTGARLPWAALSKLSRVSRGISPAPYANDKRRSINAGVSDARGKRVPFASFIKDTPKHGIFARAGAGPPRPFNFGGTREGKALNALPVLLHPCPDVRNWCFATLSCPFSTSCAGSSWQLAKWGPKRENSGSNAANLKKLDDAAVQGTNGEPFILG